MKTQVEKVETIILLCSRQELNRERKGYYDSFCEFFNVVLYNEHDGSLSDLISKLKCDGKRILFILYPDPYITDIPEEILMSEVPTACFQIDTYNGTSSRIKQSMLFDYVFVFHPGYVESFQKNGHPKVFLVPHAVESHLFPPFNDDRRFDVGWIGRLDGRFYQKRRKNVKAISKHFHTNDIYKYYDQEELIDIYSNSKIGVNISRDDYLMDANLRCFEIMAAGALLITKAPNELSEIGFVDGEHFISYRNDSELISIIRYYLDHDNERIKISISGYDLVHSRHAYINRAEYIREVVSNDNGSLYGPARSWGPAKVKELLFEHFTQLLKIDKAFNFGKQLRKLKCRSIFWISKRLLKSVIILFRINIISSN